MEIKSLELKYWIVDELIYYCTCKYISFLLRSIVLSSDTILAEFLSPFIFSLFFFSVEKGKMVYRKVEQLALNVIYFLVNVCMRSGF